MLTIIAGFVWAEYDRNIISVCRRKTQYAVRVLNCARLKTEETDFTSGTDKNKSQ